MLFSPLALPNIEVEVQENGKKKTELRALLKGVARFDRKSRTNEYQDAETVYV